MTCHLADHLRIGTSGYQYRHWRDLFYPAHLPMRAWLYHYALRFDTVEINSTFYRLPAAEVFDRWRMLSPSGFCFALKYYREATHDRRLAMPNEQLEAFVTAASHLQDKLGPILVQLSPHFVADHRRLREFLEAVPGGLRWAFEFRHPTWLVPRTYSLLEAYGAALCVHDFLPAHPLVNTTDWSYFRYHGTGHGGNYPDAEMQREAEKLQALAEQGRQVFAYFNNDLGGHAVHNALELRRQVEILQERVV